MKDLVYWLRKTPQPVAVLADDKRIEVPKNNRAWRDLTQTIKALEPSKLTCLDGQGNVIRVTTLETEDEKPAPSPEMSDLQLFAKLIAEAYDKGSKSNQPVIDSAMAFVERQSERLAAAEKENDRLRGVIHKQALQIAELRQVPAPEGEGSIVDAMIAGAIQAQAVRGLPTAAKANGANGAAAAAKKEAKK